jgi:hypothetical protein
LKPDEHEKRSNAIDETSAERHASETMAAQAAQATESVEGDTNGGITPKANVYAGNGAFPFHLSPEGGRPGMPDRDEFVTAEEVP